jgi:hypothetical protein
MAIIETTAFRLVDGVTEADFLALDSRFETEFVYQQHGLIRRTMTRDDDQQWQSIVVWYDADSADASLSREPSAAVAAERDTMIQTASIVRRRYEIVG